MKAHQRRSDGLRARQAIDDAVTWRRHSLLQAGFDTAVAESVADNLGYDLHIVLQLVDLGCTPALAIKILEPLPGEVR